MAAGDHEAEIRRLLAEGLDHYGGDEIGKAIQAWRQVLCLDPGNAEALDYIQTADRREQRRLPFEEQMSYNVRRIVHEVRALLGDGNWEGAFDVLRATVESEPATMELEVTLELVRSRLLRRYSSRVGDQSALPVPCGGAADLTRFNLPTDAGFMLSLMDGATPLADVISLSGMDAFEALRVLGSLLDAGIVEMRS